MITKNDLRFATARRITALWVIAYTIDNDDGTVHIFSHSRDPEFADRDFEKRWPTHALELDEDGSVVKIRITSTGGECRWTVSNPRGRFEYDAQALIETIMQAPAGVLGEHTETLTAEVARLQGIQKTNPFGSTAWECASAAMKPLVAELARRQEAGTL